MRSRQRVVFSCLLMLMLTRCQCADESSSGWTVEETQHDVSVVDASPTENERRHGCSARCPRGNECLAGECVTACAADESCSADEVCVNGENGAACRPAIQCERSGHAGEEGCSFVYDECSDGGRYELKCQVGEDRTQVTCTCAVDGRSQMSFTWSSLICDCDREAVAAHVCGIGLSPTSFECPTAPSLATPPGP